MSGKLYGYARVSASDQNLDRQIDALGSFGVIAKQIYSDKASGKNFARPAYRRLLQALRVGDTLAIKIIDRLGRNYAEILSEWRVITKDVGAHMVVLDMPLLDTRAAPSGLTGTFIADMVLQVLSYVAEIERENIRQRQAEGIASARARGVRFGRPRIERPANWDELAARYRAGMCSRTSMLEELGISSATFYRWLRESEPIPLIPKVLPSASQIVDD